MISLISGTLLNKDLDRVEVETSGGVAYELAVPLGTFEKLPRAGDSVSLHTHLVVREDEWQLYGFATQGERKVFRRLLTATGVGPSLALGMLSTLSAERIVRAIREKDVATLQQVPRVGRKKAEQMILDLADKVKDMGTEDGTPRSDASGADDAIRALISLGYPSGEAEQAVRSAIENLGKPSGAPEIIRAALSLVKK